MAAVRQPPERGLVLHHFVARIATELRKNMIRRKLLELLGGEPASPPPLPGRNKATRIEITLDTIHGVKITLELDRNCTRGQLEDIEKVPPFVAKCIARDGLTSFMESVAAKRRSDPGNKEL